MLVLTTLLVGSDRAIAAARRAQDDDALQAMLPVLLLLLAVVGCNLAGAITARRGLIPGFVLSCLISLALTLGLRSWTLVPTGPAVFLGFLIPVLVHMGNYTVGVLERDLGISAADLEPGRGHVLDSLKSYLFTAPIVFHYLRWTMKFGEMIHRHGN